MKKQNIPAPQFIHPVTEFRNQLNAEWAKPKSSRSYDKISHLHTNINGLRVIEKQRASEENICRLTATGHIPYHEHKYNKSKYKMNAEELSQKAKYERVKDIKQRVFDKQPTTFWERRIVKVYDAKAADKKRKEV